jgi:hypothetical protein
VSAYVLEPCHHSTESNRTPAINQVIAQRRGLQKALVLHYEACIGDESRLATRVICVEVSVTTLQSCNDPFRLYRCSADSPTLHHYADAGPHGYDYEMVRTCASFHPFQFWHNIYHLHPRSRDELFDEIGLVKALAFFSDAAAEVRLEACYLFQKLTPFPFAKDAMLQDRWVSSSVALMLVHYNMNRSLLQDGDGNLDDCLAT